MVPELASHGSVVLRGGYWRVLCVVSAVVLVGLPIGILVAFADQAKSQQITLMLVGVGVGVLITCLFIRARIIVTPVALVVINPVRTHRTPWQDIETVTVTRGVTGVRGSDAVVRMRVRLRAKRAFPYRVAAAAVYYSDRHRSLAVLYDAFTRHGIVVDEE